MNPVKKFLTTSKNIEKSGAIWNMIASLMFSFQQVIVSMVITHVLAKDIGQVMAGMFAIGYADANLFLCLGKYGVRFFQVSDLEKEYNFKEYRLARIISTVAMVVVSGVFVIITANTNSYSLEKALIVFWVCMLKVPDAFEDVYFGEYQKNERLDVASKMWAIRYIVTIILMIALVIITKNLLLTVVVSTIATFIIMVVFILMTKEFISETNAPKMSNVWKQLWVTLPLALGAFLVFYIGYAPRLAIDTFIQDDSIQSIYTYLAMPVFVVQMMMTFVFNPCAYRISNYWDKRQMNEYVKECLKQGAFLVVITVCCFVGAAILGVPVLSVLFNVDMAPYKLDLLVMMIGSGCLGLATLLGNLLTVMRYQKAILWGYAASAIISLLVSNRAVNEYGIRGAVFSYVAILLLLCLIFIGEFIYGVLKNKRSSV